MTLPGVLKQFRSGSPKFRFYFFLLRIVRKRLVPRHVIVRSRGGVRPEPGEALSMMHHTMASLMRPDS